MKIDRAEARRIADLAHLAFDDAALDRLAAEMTRILEYIERLGDVPEAASEDARLMQPTPLRGDAAGPSLARDAVEANAPSWSGGFFVVPPVIESE